MTNGETSRYVPSASEIYDQIDFNTQSVFNKPSPAPWVAFLIGAVSSYNEDLEQLACIVCKFHRVCDTLFTVSSFQQVAL